MAYLQSHRGDYLSGYQGGFGSVLGGLLRRGFGAAARLAMGPAGTAAAIIAPPIIRALPGVPTPGGGRLNLPAFLPGGAPLYTPPAAVTQTGDLPPRGYRLNKSSYWLKDGTFVQAGTRFVRVRRRNMANGRALRRSITRVKGFERLVKSSRKSLKALAKI